MREPGTLRSVFVSSTSVDLHVYREAVKRAIERMDQRPLVMGNFGAQGHGDAVLVCPHRCARAMPRLQSAKTRACGRLTCGNALDTVSSHADTTSRRDMVYLLGALGFDLSPVCHPINLPRCFFDACLRPKTYP